MLRPSAQGTLRICSLGRTSRSSFSDSLPRRLYACSLPVSSKPAKRNTLPKQSGKLCASSRLYSPSCREGWCSRKPRQPRSVAVGRLGTKGLTTRTKDAEILYWLESSTFGKRYGNDRCRWGGRAVSWHCHAVRHCTHPAKRANCCAAGRSAQRASTRGANPSVQTPRTAKGAGNGTGTG